MPRDAESNQDQLHVPKFSKSLRCSQTASQAGKKLLCFQLLHVSSMSQKLQPNAQELEMLPLEQVSSNSPCKGGTCHSMGSLLLLEAGDACVSVRVSCQTGFHTEVLCEKS